MKRCENVEKINTKLDRNDKRLFVETYKLLKPKKNGQTGLEDCGCLLSTINHLMNQITEMMNNKSEKKQKQQTTKKKANELELRCAEYGPERCNG